MQIKYFLLGFITACVLGLGGMIGFLDFGVSDTMAAHDQLLPSGKGIRVTSCNLVWGVEHDDRYPDKDCFALEFVSSAGYGRSAGGRRKFI